jgi:hypothetical protein
MTPKPLVNLLFRPQKSHNSCLRSFLTVYVFFYARQHLSSPYPFMMETKCCYSYDKVKQSRYTPWRRLGERRYSSYSFTTSALDGGEWPASCPGRALPPGTGPTVPIGHEAGWAPEPVWTQRIEEKSFASAGNRTPIARSSSP